MLLTSSIFLDAENLYKDPKVKCPINKIIKDTKNCFFSLINQYTKKIRLVIIKKETPKLSTESIENVLGGKKGKVNDSSNKTATTILTA